MFARVITSEISGDRAVRPEPAEYIRNTVVPVAEKQKGLKAAYWFLNKESSKGIAIMIYETEKDLQDSEESARQTRERGAQEVGVRFTSVEEYELVAEAKPVAARV